MVGRVAPKLSASHLWHDIYPYAFATNRSAQLTDSHTLIGMAPAQREPKVVVLGGGSWGTTVASICARRGPTLQWVRSKASADDINEKHRNSKYLGNEVELAHTLKATTDFSEAADCADVIVMGAPSHGFRGVLTELGKERGPRVPVVSLVKGLEQGTNYRMSQIVAEVLPGHPAGILAGPKSPERRPRATPPPRCSRCPTSNLRRIWQTCSAPDDFARTPPMT